MTYTYAELRISEAAFNEIAAKLRTGGYENSFQVGGAIDMHGIALTCEPRRQAKPTPCPKCNLRHPDNIPCQVGPAPRPNG